MQLCRTGRGTNQVQEAQTGQSQLVALYLVCAIWSFLRIQGEFLALQQQLRARLWLLSTVSFSRVTYRSSCKGAV